MFGFILATLFIVEGSSMQPTINAGEYVETITGPCKVGDIIAFEYENERYIKTLDHYTGRGYMGIRSIR